MSRGSQFKVESFMFRIAKPENFILISPSKGDVSLLVILPSIANCRGQGWKAERCRVYAFNNGASLGLLLESTPRT